MKYTLVLLTLALGLGGCDNTTTTLAPDADNSGINKRDRGSQVKTPMDQNENQKDIDITADIRRQVVASKMSINAQNIKIMTQDGKVTLRGPVATAEEKSMIESIAGKVAGESNLDSQIDVSMNN